MDASYLCTSTPELLYITVGLSIPVYTYLYNYLHTHAYTTVLAILTVLAAAVYIAVTMTLKHKASLKSLNFGKAKTKGKTSVSPKTSHKGGFATLVHKWKEALRAITRDTLDQMDGDSSDEQISALFDRSRNAVPVKNIISFNEARAREAERGEREAQDLARLEMKLTDEQSAEKLSDMQSAEIPASLGRTTATSRSEQPGTASSSDSEDESRDPFDSYDDVEACRALRKQTGEPFCDAAKIWRQRRELWQLPTNAVTQGDIDQRRHGFQQIPAEYYDRVYKKLVMEDKPLREPLNLQDALKVINAGWTETKKWERAANGRA